jgi:hypothetical protein
MSISSIREEILAYPEKTPILCCGFRQKRKKVMVSLV